MKICTILENEVLVNTLRDADMIDKATPSIPKQAVVVDTELPKTNNNETLAVFGERDKNGHYLTSKNVKVIPDFRGQTVYQKTDGKAVEITELGALKDSVTLKYRPTEHHQFKQGDWVLDSAGKAKQLQVAIERGAAQIDAAVTAVYDQFNQFILEYQLREAQAIAFKEGGYKGAVPDQVAAYADPAGLEPHVACEHILASAEKLRHALNELGKLRMRKVHLRFDPTVESVEAETSEVLTKVKAIAEAL